MIGTFLLSICTIEAFQNPIKAIQHRHHKHKDERIQKNKPKIAVLEGKISAAQQTKKEYEAKLSTASDDEKESLQRRIKLTENLIKKNQAKIKELK